uniref:CCR4-NOT transcription complex subunit 11 n=1 Tax=Chromera velia CCMP2878 TaxID=1169474 RepID=A0A0G4H4K3_9ALVE|mmetsp:Transcript_13054/g.25598  ORF Transcript_13054/g.25598 Transcript_13054/m.25598 type:complete len:488 (-) Transcript_13054:86-1549(-)|eukprot:Cvel_844.t1-p1 / transcript=Cvel_844.t1 / gene=Cvel_844 / organism=Chromera_velia_CCMP2878 / gene_product=CCR4-NOT transcription complex subunit 11, putative / transcript_product=CCR4-NOT transcription complex subunit 11, putative / location=Cvel_scaffold26:98315-106949(-) / protein_length=487 / sequence_SO=supercontig / SO=protein_coding / is_pseudo=false
MLTQSELESLIHILSGTDKTFSDAAAPFYKTFPKHAQFRVGSAICLLLRNSLLRLPERLLSFYLLYDIYRSEHVTTTPFVPIVLDTLEQSVDAIEKRFLLQFLTSLPKELPKQVVQDWIEQAEESIPPTIPDLDPFRKIHKEGAPKLPASALASSAGVSPVFPDRSFYWGDDSRQTLRAQALPPGILPVSPPSFSSSASSSSSSPSLHSRLPSLSVPPSAPLTERSLQGRGGLVAPERPLRACEVSAAELSLQPHLPPLSRPPPPVFQPSCIPEVHWIHVPLLMEPLWDEEMCAEEESSAVLREVLAAALVRRLTESELQSVRAAFEKHKGEVLARSLSPPRLTDLVEHNLSVARDFLVRIKDTPEIADHLQVLVSMGNASMEQSLTSMELVNKLVCEMEMPEEFLRTYVVNCLSCCNAMTNKFMKKRLSRLVCVFLNTLIYNRLLDPEREDDLMAQIRSFCTDIMDIKEASQLFKRIQSKTQKSNS